MVGGRAKYLKIHVQPVAQKKVLEYGKKMFLQGKC